MTIVLGIDTSATVGAGVAVDGVAVATAVVPDTRAHAEQLMPLVQRVVAESGIGGLDAVTAIAVGVGPGPFTGLRVGVVAAAVLAEALGVGVRGVCSLDVLAHQVVAGGLAPGSEFVVATDARRKEWYWARYTARDADTGDGPSGSSGQGGTDTGDSPFSMLVTDSGDSPSVGAEGADSAFGGAVPMTSSDPGFGGTVPGSEQNGTDTGDSPSVPAEGPVPAFGGTVPMTSSDPAFGGTVPVDGQGGTDTGDSPSVGAEGSDPAFGGTVPMASAVRRVAGPFVSSPGEVPDLPRFGPVTDAPLELDPGVLAAIAADLPEAGLEPLYLRRPDAQVPTARKSTLLPPRLAPRSTR